MLRRAIGIFMNLNCVIECRQQRDLSLGEPTAVPAFPSRVTRTMVLALAVLAARAVVAADGDAPIARRPNILFCIADDWARHAGAYGDKVIRTPNFDRVAREGALFNNAFCAAPSCSPSRAGILTGQWVHRLDQAASLNGPLFNRFAIYPDLLEAAGYFIGLQGKGWSPGPMEAGGWKRNPAGPRFPGFAEFLKARPKDRPFCFWFGSVDPHRNYAIGAGAHSRLKPGGEPADKLDGPAAIEQWNRLLAQVEVPPYLPDTAMVRSDILDYYFEVERFDRDLGRLLEQLAAAGELDQTLIVVTADNGWPFPRGKTNLYDAGTRQPLAIRWPARFGGGRVLDQIVSLTDLAPTFLEAAALRPPPEMTGRSLLPLLTEKSPRWSNRVLLERERHANVREGDLSYPSRALRTPEFLFIRNFRPERWPAGDPIPYMQVGPFGDIDWGPTKDHVLAGRDDPRMKKFFDLACAKRPAEELYDLKKDPHQIRNVAADPAYAKTRRALRAELDTWLKETGDPRVLNDDDRWDKFEYMRSRPTTRIK